MGHVRDGDPDDMATLVFGVFIGDGADGVIVVTGI